MAIDKKKRTKGIVKAHPAAVEMLRARGAGPHIAHGFRANKALNLVFHGGKIIPDLQFKNYYLGQWQQSDMDNIDHALSAALSDTNLNHVIQQYFTAGPISTHFLGREQRGISTLTPKSTFNRDNVHATLATLNLSGIDLSTTVICLYLPPGVILDTKAKGGVGNEKGGDGDEDDKDNSKEGLGGYHGSAHINGQTVYFAVAVYSQQTSAGINGIPFWPDSWKNIVATMYHELNEARTDPDVEEAIRDNDDSKLGWYSQQGGEIGDIPINEAGENLGLAMVEVPLVSGGSAPIQLMWSNAVGGPCGPF
jgi:hypothetical protein